MLRNPAIIILDEPTAALDAHTEAHITQSLEQLMKGKTTFIIAHRLSTVKKADMIIVLENKAITATGTHGQLLKTSKLYQDLCALQNLE